MVKTRVANNDVIVEIDVSFTNPPSSYVARFTHTDVCKTADRSLFVVPSGLTCSTMSSIEAQAHMSPQTKLLIAMHSLLSKK